MTIEVGGRYAANNAETLRQMAIDGMGIVRLTDLTVGSALQSGELVPILTAFNHVDRVPLQALTPPGKHRLPKVSAMLDFLVEQFGQAPWRAHPRRPNRPPCRERGRSAGERGAQGERALNTEHTERTENRCKQIASIARFFCAISVCSS